MLFPAILQKKLFKLIKICKSENSVTWNYLLTIVQSYKWLWQKEVIGGEHVIELKPCCIFNDE